MTSEGYFDKFLLPPKFIAYNVFYYFFGRFTGIVWYFFPAALALAPLLPETAASRPLASPRRARGRILIYIMLMPDNYGGGGGSLANRYFLNIYPALLLPPREDQGAGARSP